MKTALIPASRLAKLKTVGIWRAVNEAAWDLIVRDLGYVPTAVVSKSGKLLSPPYPVRAMARIAPDFQVPTVLVDDLAEALISLINAGGVDHRLNPGMTDSSVVDLLLSMAKSDLESVRLTGIEMEDFGTLLEELASDRPPVFSPPPPAPTLTDWEVPILDLSLQADTSYPAVKWGTRARDSSLAGCLIHFYTHDRKFNALTDDASMIVRSGAAAAVELNISMSDDMPLPVALFAIWQKRRASSQWQAGGIHVLVDMNVPDRWFGLNLQGVPAGWRAYANRGYRDDPRHVERAYERACQHANTDDILYVVYSGGKVVKALCQRRGWHWIPDAAETARDGT